MLKSLFNEVALQERLFCYGFCEILKNIYFLIIPRNQAMLQRK